jgi:hypothetical protein
MQGYRFGKPSPAEEIADRLQKVNFARQAAAS